ncbi:MAG: GyrI-like domain-containing protein [Acidobacteriota bacterium]
MYTIGRFSRISGLTIKTLHLYHERGLLEPTWVDPSSNYRYYDSASLQRARIIRYLRELRLPLDSIAGILTNARDDSEALQVLVHHRNSIEGQLEDLKRAAHQLDQIIARERAAQEILGSQELRVVEKRLDAVRIAGRRWKGRYDQTGEAFGRLFRQVGSAAHGPGFNLYYDEEFKEEDADIETCVPVRSGRQIETEEIQVRELPGGDFLSLIYTGPYSEVSAGYARLAEFQQARGIELGLPSREIYLKGPGLIFPGNPIKYVTEIQVPLK